MSWEDIIKRKRKRYPTTAQKKNKNWNNLSDEERMHIRSKRHIKGEKKREENELERLRTCPNPKCGWKDNLRRLSSGNNPYASNKYDDYAKFCAKCGTKMRERE